MSLPWLAAIPATMTAAYYLALAVTGQLRRR